MVTKNTIQKWTKDLNIHFSEEKIPITPKFINKHLKRCLILLTIREMQIKATINTISYHQDGYYKIIIIIKIKC